MENKKIISIVCKEIEVLNCFLKEDDIESLKEFLQEWGINLINKLTEANKNGNRTKK